jgi:hypothetical protein
VGAASWAQGGLSRGGDSPEGASVPRARRRIARGGVRPSSETETRPRGRQALERDGESPERALGPRARRSSLGVAPGPRARWELSRGRPRPIVWWAVVASLGRRPFHFGPRPHGACFRFAGIFVCVLLSFRKEGFPWLLGTLVAVPDK